MVVVMASSLVLSGSRGSVSAWPAVRDRAFLISRRVSIGGIGTFSGRAPLTPGGLPGFKGPFPSTSLDKGLCGWQVRRASYPHTQEPPHQLAGPILSDPPA